MNPWALLVMLLGIVLIIIGVKGTQHNITGAITGKAAQNVGGIPSGVPAGGPYPPAGLQKHP